MKIDLDALIRSVVGKDQDMLIRADLIKQQLAAIDHTPDHPVYSALIREALLELNEGKGSSREAISQFIASKYDVLPVIHSAKLIEQLDKLVKKKEVLFTTDNCYVLPVESNGVAPKLTKGNKRSMKIKQDRKIRTFCEIKGDGRMQDDIPATKEVKVRVEQIGYKPLVHELQLTTDQEKKQNDDSLSTRPEHSMHELQEDKNSTTTSSGSQKAQRLDPSLLLQNFGCKKEIYVDLLKKAITLRQELSKNIEYMSLVEESSFASFQPTVRELVMALQAEIEAIFRADTGSSSAQDYDLKELHLDLHQENLDFKGHELRCSEKSLKYCRALTAPGESLELPKFELVQQQPEQPKEVDLLKQEQQGPAQLKMALEKNTCATEPESPFEDIPPGFGSIVELEQHKSVGHHCEPTKLEQLCLGLQEEVTLIDNKDKHKFEPGREEQCVVSSHDDSVGITKTSMVELQKLREVSGVKIQKTSPSISSAAINVHMEQTIEIDATFDKNDLIVVATCRPLDGEERAFITGCPEKLKRPRRQLRSSTANSRGCDQSHVEATSGDVGVVPIPNRGSKRKKKLESSIQEGDQRHIFIKDENPEHSGLLKKSRSRELVPMHQKQQQQLQLLQKEMQSLPSQPENCSGQDVVVMQPKKRDLSSPPLLIELSSGKDSEDLLSLPKEKSWQDDPEQPSQNELQDITGKELTSFHGDQYRKNAKTHRGRPRKLVDSADECVQLSSPSKRGAKQIQGQSLDYTVKQSKSKPLAVDTVSTRKLVLGLSKEFRGRITRARAAAN